MIVLKNVSKEFRLSKKQQQELGTNNKSILAVDQISFSCKAGRIFTLLGPNGAGKTTTLRMLATVLKPTSGEIYLNGFNSQTNELEVRKKIGFLTGNTGLYDRLTPNEYIQYFGNLYQMDQQTFKLRKAELFNTLNIDGFANRRIGQLSTGMRQKVSIVRTIIHDPDIVIFDEPTAGLDVITAKNIIDLIRKCKEEQKTIIFSSHIMGEVELLCDDLAIINEGKLVFNNTIESFRNQMKSNSLTEEFIRITSEN